MKSQEEKKTRRVPTRMTQGQYDRIRKKAEERNMSVSAFIVETASHSEQAALIPSLLRIQNLVNLAAGACEDTSPGIAAEIRKEAAELWSSLK